METSRTLKVFFDTNVLERRHEESKVPINRIYFSPDFYAISRYVKENGLEDKIELCIPEIVLQEICIHMKKCFIDSKSTINNFIHINEKTFGDLLEISYQIKIDDYDEYLDTLMQEFLSSTPVSIIPFEKTESAIKNIVEKALRSEKPFASGKLNGKHYSDAGLKDVLILDSIILHSNGSSAILFTQDRDFSNSFGNNKNLYLANSLEDVINRMEDMFTLDMLKIVEKEFMENEYLKENLLDSVGIINDDSLTQYKMASVDQYDIDIYKVIIKCCSNEVYYELNVLFDTVANEIIKAVSTTSNE